MKLLSVTYVCVQPSSLCATTLTSVQASRGSATSQRIWVVIPGSITPKEGLKKTSWPQRPFFKVVSTWKSPFQLQDLPVSLFCQKLKVGPWWVAALWSLDPLGIISTVCGEHYVAPVFLTSTLPQLSFSVWKERWFIYTETPPSGSGLNTLTQHYQVAAPQTSLATIWFSSQWNLNHSLCIIFRS